MLAMKLTRIRCSEVGMNSMNNTQAADRLFDIFGALLPMGRQYNPYHKVNEKVRRSYRYARPTLEDHNALLGQHPTAPLAVVCGPGSGICAIELAHADLECLEPILNGIPDTPTMHSNDGSMLIMLFRYPDFDLPQTVRGPGAIRLLGMGGLIELSSRRGGEFDDERWLVPFDEAPLAPLPERILAYARPIVKRNPASGITAPFDEFVASHYAVDHRCAASKKELFRMYNNWRAQQGHPFVRWELFQQELKQRSVHEIDDGRYLYGLKHVTSP